jgi:phage-related protein
MVYLNSEFHGTERLIAYSVFEKGNKIILCNGFIKKTQKTPKQEILKAIKIKEEYKYENEK